MLTLVAIIHIVACVLLIALVLLQDPKNSGSSAVFGGTGTNNVIGATGAATLLQKMTTWSAIIFGICCLLLALLTKQNMGSVFESAPAPVTSSAPVAPPSQAPAGESSTAPQAAPPAPVETEKK